MEIWLLIIDFIVLIDANLILFSVKCVVRFNVLNFTLTFFYFIVFIFIIIYLIIR
jgi:hypothetical protein